MGEAGGLSESHWLFCCETESAAAGGATPREGETSPVELQYKRADRDLES